MTTNVLDQLAATEQQAAADFDQLVRDVADGRDVSPDDATGILSRASKSRMDLETAVTKVAARRAKLDEFRSCIEAGARADELQQEVGRLIAEREATIQAARDKCAAAGVPIEGEIRTLRQQASHAGQLQHELARECPNAAAVFAYQQAHHKLVEIIEGRKASAKLAREFATSRDIAVQRNDETSAREYATIAQKHHDRLQALKAEQPAAQERADALRQELSKA